MNVDEIRALAREEVFPTLPGRYEERSFSRDLWDAMARAGLFGFYVPRERGGSGAGTEALLDAVDAFVTQGCDLGLALSWLDHLIIHTHVIQRFGTPDQRAALLPSLARGECIGALAASEPGTGADPAKMRATATHENGSYTIRAHKIFITNGPVADRIIVLARTGPRPGKEGISAFLLHTPAPGFQVRETMALGFLNTSPHGELAFDACRVPPENLLGGIGQGHVGISRAVFSWERHVLLCALGAHFRALLDRVIERVSRLTAPRARETERTIAACHVTLEALRETARLHAVRAMERTVLDRAGMERLLFLAHGFQRWWEGLAPLLDRLKEVSADPVLAILVRDAALLQVGRAFFRSRLERVGRELLSSAASEESPPDETFGLRPETR